MILHAPMLLGLVVMDLAGIIGPNLRVRVQILRRSVQLLFPAPTSGSHIFFCRLKDTFPDDKKGF